MARFMWLAIVPLLLAAAALMACGDDDDDESYASVQAAATAAPAAVFAAATATPIAAPRPSAAAVTEGADDGDVAFQQVNTGRSIVYVGSMFVEVEDVRQATQQAQLAIAGLGGLVFSQHTTTEPVPRTELTFKVLPEDFAEAMRRLEALGDLKSQQISADDVTERVVDLESRIITSRASVERLRSFLEKATELETVAELESQLLARETDLERLRGQLRTIQDLVALATVSITLVEPEPERPEARVEFVETAYSGDDDGARCPAADDLAVDEDEPITVCVSVENTGNVALVEIEIFDFGLGFDNDDFVTLEGSVAGPLQPRERLLGYFRTEAEVGLRPAAGILRRGGRSGRRAASYHGGRRLRGLRVPGRPRRLLADLRRRAPRKLGRRRDPRPGGGAGGRCRHPVPVGGAARSGAALAGPPAQPPAGGVRGRRAAPRPPPRRRATAPRRRTADRARRGQCRN